MDKEMYLRIARPQNTCVRCNRPLCEEGKHPSIILADGESDPDSDAPVRQDFCLDCWKEIREQDYFSFWLTRREKPKPRRIQSRKERNATLLSYFDLLVQKNDPEYAQHLFFLAHLLMKYSVLRWVRSEPPAQPGGNERVVFRNTATDDLVTIDCVPLDDERVLTIKKEIDGYLSRIEDCPGDVQ